MNHLGTRTLETERLILRPFVWEDREAMFHNWEADPEVTKYLRWQHYTSLEDVALPIVDSSPMVFKSLKDLVEEAVCHQRAARIDVDYRDAVFCRNRLDCFCRRHVVDDSAGLVWLQGVEKSDRDVGESGRQDTRRM